MRYLKNQQQSDRGSKQDLILALRQKIKDPQLARMTIQTLTGQLLLASFKDYLIYDEVYDFVECFTGLHDSRKEIIHYIQI